MAGAGAYVATNRPCRELAAPLSLLVDHFGLPAENFLTQMALTASDTQSDVVVHPVKEGRLLNAVSLSLDSLALLTRELVLSVENSVLITLIYWIFRSRQTVILIRYGGRN